MNNSATWNKVSEIWDTDPYIFFIIPVRFFRQWARDANDPDLFGFLIIQVFKLSQITIYIYIDIEYPRIKQIILFYKTFL